MKNLIFRLCLSICLIITLIVGDVAALQASKPEFGKPPELSQLVLKGGYLANIVDHTADGSPIYQADFGAPTYCEDLVTPIDTQWHVQKDGSLTSGANQFSSRVSAEQTTVGKGNENIQWTPALYLVGANQSLDLRLYPQNPQPELLDIDPLNKNYQKNTLIWHYDNCIDRCFRLIEAQCQEYFVINEPLEHDLVIDPNATQTAGFVWYEKASAYDQAGTGVQLTEDENKKVTLKAASARESWIVKDKVQAQKSLFKNEVKQAQLTDIAEGKEPEVMYPIVIDPNYTFTTSASDGFVFGFNADYNTAWTNANGAFYPGTWGYFIVGQLRSSQYFINRAALYFDTSGLSSNATITAAILKLYGCSDQSNPDFNLQLVNGQTTYPHDPLVVGDYNKSYYSGNGGILSTVGFVTGGYNELNLNSTGLGWINKDSPTKLFLRSSRDISGIPPLQWGMDYVDIGAYEGGVGYRPQLLVTFTGPPMPPTNVQATDGNFTDKTQISWTASSGATGYSIYRNTVDNGIKYYVGNSTTVTYNDTSAIPGPTYFYWVLAYNGYGEGDFSVPDTGWRGDFYYNGMHWSAGSTTYNLSSIGDSTWRTAINSAAATWNGAGATFSFTNDSNSSHNWTTANRGNNFGIIMLTTWSWSGDSISDCDTEINTYYTWSTDGSAFDIQSTACHEFGHWLSLGHVTSPSAVMYGGFYSTEIRRNLATCDINGIKYIYP